MMTTALARKFSMRAVAMNEVVVEVDCVRPSAAFGFETKVFALQKCKERFSFR
jgi:hypothetical protein